MMSSNRLKSNLLSDSYRRRKQRGMEFNLRYIPKKTNSSPRRIQDTSLRIRPYYIPERSRTKSESADLLHDTKHFFDSSGSSGDSNSNSNSAGINCSPNTVNGLIHSHNTTTMMMMDTSGDSNILADAISGGGAHSYSETGTRKFNLKKKSKSLEDVRSENLDGSQPSHEMEFVSSRIQKLKVQD